MSRSATLPFGEVVSVPDNTPTLILESPPGVAENGRPRYGFAPWGMQGAQLALTPRRDARSGLRLPTPAERDGAFDLTRSTHEEFKAFVTANQTELQTLELARLSRTTPALGVTWFLRTEVGVGASHEHVTVAASTIEARTRVLLWLDVSQRPAPMAEMDGPGWCPATIDAHPTYDVESLGGGFVRHLVPAGELPNSPHRDWSSPGVWHVSVPFRARSLGTFEGRPAWEWTPRDTAPGTVYLWPDGVV